MNIGFNDVLKGLGFGVGAITGGPSQVKAVSGFVALSSKVNTYLNSFGKQIGAWTGSQAFESVAAGASESARTETDNFVSKNIFTPQVRTTIGFVAVGVLILMLFFLRKK